MSEMLKQKALIIARAFDKWNLWKGGGGGGGSIVSINRKVNKGQNIFDLTIDGSVTQIYVNYWEYSTDEKIVGYFADNKPIYEKCFYYNNIYFGNETIFNTGLTGIKHAWVEGGFFTDSETYYRLPVISGGSWVIYSAMKITNGNANIRFRANDYYNPNPLREFYFRIQYTKIDD